ncbi:MAG: prepilin-type N-terminal cleavage/methylation domain-containing protein [Pseudomonadota bacterium]
MKSNSRGFTLMEMIGVVAVIAILAAMATPMIFDAIRNARVSAFAQDIRTVKAAVARFYADTGRFPMHRPNNGNTNNHQLLRNTTGGIPGWEGPYIENELEGPIPQTSGNFGVWPSRTQAVNQFDLDGDGTVDTTSTTVMFVTITSEADARKLSDIFDGDGDVETGASAWFTGGIVKRQNGNNNYVIYLAGE